VSTTARDPWLTNEWATRVGVRSVLAVVHNVTAATRLFDVLPLIAGDDRIRVVFTRTGSSAFDEGTTEYLAAHGVHQISWAEAVVAEFDLAIAASHGGELHELRCPIFIVPHGMGYNKYLRKSVFGLSVDWLVHDGKVVPTVLVLSHAEQLDRLRRDCPDAATRALVAGDIVFDQLVASQALRATYRRAFGVPRGQRLVLVSSTWGQESLLGKDPGLVTRLAEQLPADEFRIAVALHPNVWFGHSRWQVSQWLASCRHLGVSVLAGMDEWRAAAVAADLTVGDHGSIPFYTTALGTPILLATAPEHTVAPDSPIAALLSMAPRLDPSGDLEKQVRRAVTEHSPEQYAEITALVTSVPNRAATVLREALYRVLNLPEPDFPAEVAPLPVPPRVLDRPTAHLAYVQLDGPRSATVTRFPAERLRTDTTIPRGAHLVTEVTSTRHRWLELADVIVGVEGTHTEDWITDTLARLPGCALAAAPEPGRGWLLGDRTGTVLQTDSALFASVAYQVGGRLDDLRGEWLVRVGTEQHRVTVR
jgi:hypothetical protein